MDINYILLSRWGKEDWTSSSTIWWPHSAAVAWVWHVPCPIGSRVWTLGPQGLQPRWRRGGPWGVPWSFKWHLFPYYLLCVKAKGQLAWVSSPSTVWVPGWNSSCQAWCQVLYLLSCLTDPTGDFMVHLHFLFAFYFFLWLECDWQPRHDGLHPSNYKPKEVLPQGACGQLFSCHNNEKHNLHRNRHRHRQRLHPPNL